MPLTHNAPKLEQFQKSTMMNPQRMTWRGDYKIEEIAAVTDQWEQLHVCVQVLSKMLDEQILVNRRLTQALQGLPSAAGSAPTGSRRHQSS